MASYPVALFAAGVAPRARKSVYPEELASRIGERIKRPLGDPFGLTIFGVNLTTLKPGAMSALRHAHTVQDEFVYILEGELIVEPVGREPITLKQGETAHLAPDVVHAAKNGSQIAPAKVLVFLVMEKGRPLAEAVK